MSWTITPRFTQWTPALITTALWLDAADATTLFTTNAGSTVATNGSAVGRWNDKSGNNRNATQATSANRPSCLTGALNGRQGVQFTANDRWLEVVDESPFDFTSTCYVFTVASISDVANSNVLINKGRATFNNNGWYLDIFGGSAQALIGVTASSSYSAVDINAALTANTPVMLSFEINGSIVRGRRNGTTYSTIVANKPAWVAATNNDTLLVGAYQTSPPNTANFEGLAHQIIIMPSVPSFSIVEKLEGWAAHYYGLTANLPANHPYKVNAPAP
jgi:hypothetical protein